MRLAHCSLRIQLGGTDLTYEVSERGMKCFNTKDVRAWDTEIVLDVDPLEVLDNISCYLNAKLTVRHAFLHYFVKTNPNTCVGFVVLCTNFPAVVFVEELLWESIYGTNRVPYAVEVIQSACLPTTE